MSNPIQSHTAVHGGGLSDTVTLLSQPTTGHGVILGIAIAQPNGATSANTGNVSSITDNVSGSPNTFVKVAGKFNNSGIFADAEIWWCPSIVAGTGTYTATVHLGGTNTAAGTEYTIMEVPGGLAVDNTGSVNSGGTPGTSLIATNGGANLGTTDFVLSVFAFGNHSVSAPIGLTTPSGYTPIIVDDGTSIAGGSAGVVYRNDASAVTDSVTWGWTTSAVETAVVLASFGAAPTGAVLAGAASDTTSATGALTTGSPAPFVPILLDNASHTGDSDNIGMGNGIPGSNTGDLAPIAFTKLKQWAADVNTMMSQLYPVRSLQTPTTGFTIAAAIGVTQLVLNPAGTLATGTVTLPKAPGDNQPFSLLSSQTVTGLTMNTSDGTTVNGAPTTIAANTSVKFRFVTSLNTWFRE